MPLFNNAGETVKGWGEYQSEKQFFSHVTMISKCSPRVMSIWNVMMKNIPRNGSLLTANNIRMCFLLASHGLLSFLCRSINDFSPLLLVASLVTWCIRYDYCFWLLWSRILHTSMHNQFFYVVVGSRCYVFDSPKLQLTWYQLEGKEEYGQEILGERGGGGSSRDLWKCYWQERAVWRLRTGKWPTARINRRKFSSVCIIAFTVLSPYDFLVLFFFSKLVLSTPLLVYAICF